MSALKDPRQHDDLLNYRLKRLLRLGGAPAIRLCEGAFGVTRMEWRLVAALVEEGPKSIGDLMRRTQLESGRLSRALAALVEKGLVTRRPVPGDARRAVVAATGPGEALYEQLWPQLAAINRRLMEVLTEEESLVLEDLLARLTVQARAIHEAGGGVSVKTGRHLGGSRRMRPRPRADDALGGARFV
jgi:DNA-binding MarR family transcriptional regulator